MIRILLTSIIIACLTSCVLFDGQQRINPPYSKTVEEDEKKRILHEWFNCDECVNGQLRRVQELGDFVVDDLQAARSAPPTDVTTAAETMLGEKCERIKEGLLPHTHGTDCTQYTARFIANMTRRYEARAYHALLAIRTPDACDVLTEDICKDWDPFPPGDFTFATDRSTRYLRVDP